MFKKKNAECKVYSLITAVILFIFLYPSISLAQTEPITSYCYFVRHKISQAIEKQVSLYPSTLRKTVSLKLRLRILKSGKLKDIEVIQSSGDAKIDRVFENIARKESPFLPFPKELSEEYLALEIPIHIKPQTLELAPQPEKPPVLAKEEAQERVLKVMETKQKPAAQERQRLLAEKLEKKVAPPTLLEAGSLKKELESFYQLAYLKYQPVKIAKEQVALASLKVREAKRELYPKVSAEYSQTEGETITDPYESRAYALRLSRTLFDSGRSRNLLKRENLNLEVAHYNELKTEQQLKDDLAKAYFNLIAKYKELHFLEDTAQKVGDKYDLAKALYANKAIAEIEFLKLQTQWNQLNNWVSQAKMELEIAELKLRQVMKLSPEEEPPQINLEWFEQFSPRALNLSLEDCLDSALKNRPEIRLWELSVQAADFSKKVARVENRPKFEVQTHYGASGEAYSSEKLELADEWSLLGKLTWLFGGSSFDYSPSQDRVASTSEKKITEYSRKTEATTHSLKTSLFDRLDFYSRKKETEIAYEQNVGNLKENKEKIELEIKEAFLGCQQSLENFRVGSLTKDYNLKNVSLKDESYKIGQATLIEVVDAYMEFAQAELSYIRAKAGYLSALASLDRATGFAEEIFFKS